MSSAPLERLASRQAQYSQEQGDAEERMLGNLAQIPDMAMRTAERIQRMQMNDAAAQMRAEAVEQKRMEIERRMFEASGLYKLRTEQALAQQAKTQADAAKFALDQQKHEWQKMIGERRETRLSEQMPEHYYNTPVRNEETNQWEMRLGPGRTRKALPEEVESHLERLRMPAVQNQQRQAMGEAATQRAKQGPAAKSPLQRFNTATLSIRNLSADMLLLPPDEKARRMDEIKAMHAEMGDAMKDMEAERATPEPATMPAELSGILSPDQYQTLRQQGLTDDVIRERLKKAGRLK